MPVYSYGKLIGSRIVHNDRLLMFMLRNRAPSRFGADGRVTARRNTIGDPVDANRLSRLKRQWHKEWDEAHAREQAAEDDETTAAIDAQLDRLQEGWLEDMTSTTRALYIAYTAAANADTAAGRTAWNEPEYAALTGRTSDAPRAEAGDEWADEWASANITRRIELSDFSQSKEQDQ